MESLIVLISMSVQVTITLVVVMRDVSTSLVVSDVFVIQVMTVMDINVIQLGQGLKDRDLHSHSHHHHRRTQLHIQHNILHSILNKYQKRLIQGLINIVNIVLRTPSANKEDVNVTLGTAGTDKNVNTTVQLVKFGTLIDVKICHNQKIVSFNPNFFQFFSNFYLF